MTTRSISSTADMWARHTADWRETAQVASFWREASSVDPRLLETRADAGWWDILERLGITLLVTREYEHLVVALSALRGIRRQTHFAVPHPSGLAVDRDTSTVFVASTRNPNQVYSLRPAVGSLRRKDMRGAPRLTRRLVPVGSTILPGCLYLHDLAFIGRSLYGNAVGQNAVVRLGHDGRWERAWWPRCIEDPAGSPRFEQNYIQLNSIAAGSSLRDSYFSASSQTIGRRRPGHLDYPVDGRGVIFSGRTKEPVCTGLTRPHSARLKGHEIWVDNSGYGEVGVIRGGRFDAVRKMPGWTRGLTLVKGVAFVGTSRVIPRFRRYAPGVDLAASRCAVHAISCNTGERLGTLEWPWGNQIFAIDWIGSRATAGFAFDVRSRRQGEQTRFSYAYVTEEA
jgi:uncharacterized protein (TIGR03032 family)